MPLFHINLRRMAINVHCSLTSARTALSRKRADSLRIPAKIAMIKITTWQRDCERTKHSILFLKQSSFGDCNKLRKKSILSQEILAELKHKASQSLTKLYYLQRPRLLSSTHEQHWERWFLHHDMQLYQR